MWLHFALIFLAGTALVDSTQWKPNQIYHYIVHSRGLTGVKASDQVSGFLMRGQLQVYVTSPDVLVVELSRTEHAPIHRSLPDGWNAHLSESEVKYDDMNLLKDRVKVKLRDGKIDEVFVSSKEHTSAVNFLKGMLSQLQFETDRLRSKQFRRPFENYNVYKTFTTKEQTVSGYCNTEYDVIPLVRDDMMKANLPYHEEFKEDRYLKVSKYRNYKDCLQKPLYQFAMMEKPEKDLSLKYLTRSSLTDLLISFNNEYYTIRSSVMESIMQVRPKHSDMRSLEAFNMMNLTLVKVEEATKEISPPSNLVSTGNLTYAFKMKDGHLVEPFYDNFEFSSVESDSRHKHSGMYFKRFGHDEQDSSESNSREYFIRKREADETHMEPGLMSAQEYSGPFDIVKQASIFINDIAAELMTPDELVRQGTLEKFTILTKMFRFMNEAEFAAVEEKLQITYKTAKQDQKKLFVQNVFRDAVVQSGTLAAFKVIRTWILDEKLTNLEKSLIIGQLPRVVRQPLPDYIQQFYELVKLPEVKKRPLLNTTAPYAFSELIRYALVWDQRHSYPTLSRGNIIQKEDKKKLIAIYISYFADELEEAHKVKHHSGILAYTLALGNIGHPDIIHVFKPYLEDKRNITTYQRTIMVRSLKRVCLEHPDIVRPILYHIYQNKKENYQVRVMAVNLLMEHPSGYFLLRMAEGLSNEPDLQVKNAIITGIDSLMRMKERNYDKSIANDLIAANEIVKKHNLESNIKYSVNVMGDYVDKQKDDAAWYSFNTINCRTNKIPKLMDLSFGFESSSFSPPAWRIHYGVSEMKKVMDMLKVIFEGINNNLERSLVDELAEKLHFVQDKLKPMQGSFVLSNQYKVLAFVFDDYTVQNLLNDFALLRAVPKDNIDVDTIATKLLDSEFIISYPSELGILVTYRSNVPMFLSFNGKLHVKNDSSNIQLRTEVDMLTSIKKLSKLVLTTPFRREQYFVGVGVDRQLRVPTVLNLQLEWRNNALRVEMNPFSAANKAKIWQNNVLPYTGITRCPDFKITCPFQNVRPIIIGNLQKSTKDYLYESFFYSKETDSFQGDRISRIDTSMPIDLFKNIMIRLSQPLRYHKKVFSSNFSPKINKGLVLSINYAKLRPSNEQDIIENTRTQGEIWSKLVKSSKNPRPVNTLNVRLQLLDDKIDYKCYGGITHFKELLTSKVHTKCDLLHADSSKNMEICADAEVSRTPSGCPTIDVSSEKMRQFKALVRYGKSCKDGKEINLMGIEEQTEDVQKEILNSKIYEESKKEMEAGNLGLLNTEKLCKFIDFMDDLKFSSKMDPEDAMRVLKFVIKHLIETAFRNVDIDFKKPLSQNVDLLNFINFNMKRHLYNQSMSVDVNIGPLAIHLPMDASLMPFGKLMKYRMMSFLGIEDERKFCTLGRNKLKTFDNKVYSVKIQKCPRVLMINPTKLKYDSGLNDIDKFSAIPDRNNLAISYEDIENGKRELFIMYLSKMFNIRTLEGGNRLLVNEKTIEFDESRAVKELDPYIKIAKISPTIYEIILEPAKVVIWYDGERVQIQASDEYNARVRGLCGSKDYFEETDFLLPQGCVVNKPEYAIATYTFATDKCHLDEETKRMKKEAVEKCKVIEDKRADIIIDNSSEEEEYSHTYKPSKSCNTFKTDFFMNDSEQACFSMRPIPACGKDCIAERTTKKMIHYHCEPVTSEVDEMIKRIKAGANPDFSTKSLTMSKYVQIPVKCK